MERHSTTRPAVIRRLWQIFIAVLVLTVLAELLIQEEGHFFVERIFGFNALFGFAACAALILVSKALSFVLKQPDRYYDEDRGA